jgi:hypothetical protein
MGGEREYSMPDTDGLMFCRWWDEISELVCVLLAIRVHQDAFVFDEFGALE